MTNVVGIGSLVKKSARPIAVNIFIAAIASSALLFPLILLVGRNGAGLAKLIGMALAVVYMYWACQKLHWIPYRVRDVIASLALGWMVIGASSYFPSSGGWTSWGARLALCVAFVPLAFWLGLVHMTDVRNAVAWFGQRVRAEE
jgi:O-antigen/teichoic acid export membrane protein